MTDEWMGDGCAVVRAERACERLVLDSAAHNDSAAWAELAGLYTPDAQLVRPSGEIVHGRTAIEASYRQGPAERRTRHVCTNIRVEVTDEHRASATTVVLLYSWTASTVGVSDGLPFYRPPVVGEFLDTFVHEADGWHISSRTARLLAVPPPTLPEG